MKSLRLLLLALLPVTLAVAIPIDFGNPVAERTRCERAADALDWVSNHPSAMPTTLHDFRTWEPLHQRAFLTVMEPSTKAALWREHLNEFASAHPDLTEVQHRFAADVAENLEEYARLDPADPALDQMMERTLQVFGPELARIGFGQLGTSATELTPRPPLEDCECSADGADFCDLWGPEICDYGAPCDPSMFGCGWLQLEICDGLCTCDGPECPPPGGG